MEIYLHFRGGIFPVVAPNTQLNITPTNARIELKLPPLIALKVLAELPIRWRKPPSPSWCYSILFIYLVLVLVVLIRSVMLIMNPLVCLLLPPGRE